MNSIDRPRVECESCVCVCVCVCVRVAKLCKSSLSLSLSLLCFYPKRRLTVCSSHLYVCLSEKSLRVRTRSLDDVVEKGTLVQVHQ